MVPAGSFPFQCAFLSAGGAGVTADTLGRGAANSRAPLPRRRGPRYPEDLERSETDLIIELVGTGKVRPKAGFSPRYFSAF